MDRYMTISEVSRQFQVSARMLRHYEKLGLLESERREDYGCGRSSFCGSSRSH